MHVLFALAGYVSCIMATMMTATLNRDRSHLAYIWTRPRARERIALGYLAIDIVTILIAYALVSAVAAVIVSNIRGVTLILDSETATSVIRYAALPLMWYGLVEAATSWNGLRGGTVAGLSWAVFWGLLILRAINLPVPFEQLVALVNFLNPLAYFTNRAGMSIVLGSHGIPTLFLTFTVQTVMAYCIFVASCALAVVTWKRMEA
ncbi:MAG: hypothetical protein JO140_00145 [Candidatus Eremiobacteraeota bacterium]|nr:hypothetical protein [Candidatus Eremiobacteraeota bacterium]